MEKEEKSVFETLNAVNVSDKTEKKNGLTYLSWSWAWAETKKLFPEAFYTVYESASGLNYHHDGRTAWVKVGVTIKGLEHIEYLPVMDFRNKSIPLNSLTSFDVNKSIQRCLTKALARHGLGLYIYAGEDLPECTGETSAPEQPEQPEQKKLYTKAQAEKLGELMRSTYRDGTPIFSEQEKDTYRKLLLGGKGGIAISEAQKAIQNKEAELNKASETIKEKTQTFEFEEACKKLGLY